MSLRDLWALRVLCFFFFSFIDSQHLCGKLVCHWTHSAIVSRNDIDVQYTYLGGHICMSANLRTRRYPDPTVAANGSMCDENKVNKNFT